MEAIYVHLILFLPECFTFCSVPCRCVEHLLRNRANASKRDKQGYSPVHYAASRGHKLALEMVQCITFTLHIVTTGRLICSYNTYKVGKKL